MPKTTRALLGAVLLTAMPATGGTQVFLASLPHPNFAIGPLFFAVAVRPDLGPVTVTISWSLTLRPGGRAADIKQDLYLLWPGELVEATTPGPAEPGLARELERRAPPGRGAPRAGGRAGRRSGVRRAVPPAARARREIKENPWSSPTRPSASSPPCAGSASARTSS